MPPSEPGLARPYRWLAEALQLVRAHVALFVVAASAMLLIALLPALLQSFAAAALPNTLVVQVGIYVLFTVLLLPPVTGGFYRLADAAQRGQAPRPMQVFDVLADGRTSARLVLVNLVFLLLLVLGVIMPIAAIGGAPLAEWLRQLATLAPDSKTFPPMPPGTGPLFAVALLVAVLVNTAKELAMAQAALSERAPLEAVADGFRIALRNAGTLLLFYVPVFVLAVLGFFVMALVAGVVSALLGFIAQPLAYLVVMLAVVGVVLAYYALVFAFFYRAWRATLAGKAADLPPDPPTHGIEV